MKFLVVFSLILAFSGFSKAQDELVSLKKAEGEKKTDDKSVNKNDSAAELINVNTKESNDKSKTGNLSDSLEEVVGYRTKQYISLTIGIEQDVKLPPLPENFQITKDNLKGDFRKIVSVSVNKELGVFRFTPNREGFANLTIHDKKTGKTIVVYRIDVRKNRLDKVAYELKSLLAEIEGIQIKVVNNRVVIDGQILLPRDMSRIYSVAKQFGDQVSIIVSMSPVAMKKIAEFIARDIGNPEIEVRAVNSKFFITGTASSETEKQNAINICELYMPDAILDEAEAAGVVKKRKPMCYGDQIGVKSADPPPPKKMVQMVIHYVELKKDYSKAFKFQWTPAISDQTGMQFTVGDSGGGIITSLTGVISNLLPKLNWAKTHGHARVLESTSLLVQEGKKGEIKQTTEYSFNVIGANNTPDTKSKEVGLSASITPVIEDGKSGSVVLDMQFSISSPVGTGANGFPIIAQNSVTTMVTVRDRQSAAVGGLIRNNTATNFNRNPAKIDPIISLFASKDFARDQSQFVVFITPVIKASASAGSEQLKKKFRLRE